MPGTRGIKAGRAYVEIGADRTALERGLKAAQKRLRAFGASVSTLGTRSAAAGLAVLAPLVAASKVFSTLGDRIQKAALRTGFGAEALSELGFAAEQSGADFATLEKGIKTMQRSIGNAGRGLSTATDALESLGLTFAELDGLSPEEQFNTIADRIAAIDDPTKKAAVAMELFGRAGQQLIPLLSLGSRGMQELRDQAKSLGLSITDLEANSAAKLTDAFNVMKRSLQGAIFAIGSALAPSLTEILETTSRVVVSISNWIKENRSLVVSAAKVAAIVVGVGTAIAGIGAAIVAAGLVLGGLASVVAAIGTAFGVVSAILGAILTPVGLVVAAIAGIGTAVLGATGIGARAIESLRSKFQAFRSFFGGILKGMSDALAAGDVELAAEILWLGLQSVWQAGIVKIKNLWLDLKEFTLKTMTRLATELVRIWDTIVPDKLVDAITVGVPAVAKGLGGAVQQGAEKLTEAVGPEVSATGLVLKGAGEALFDNAERGTKALAKAAASPKTEEDRDRFEEIESGIAAERAKAEQAAAEAAAKLAAAIAEAARKREQADRQVGKDDAGLRLEEIAETLQQGSEAAESRVSAVGTFSAREASSLVASNAAERTAKGIEKSNQFLRRIDRNIQTSGIAFA